MNFDQFKKGIKLCQGQYEAPKYTIPSPKTFVAPVYEPYVPPTTYTTYNYLSPPKYTFPEYTAYKAPEVPAAAPPAPFVPKPEPVIISDYDGDAELQLCMEEARQQVYEELMREAVQYIVEARINAKKTATRDNHMIQA